MSLNSNICLLTIFHVYFLIIVCNSLDTLENSPNKEIYTTDLDKSEARSFSPSNRASDSNSQSDLSTVTFKNTTYELNDINKEVIDYGDSFIDALTFAQTIKRLGAEAPKYIDSMISKHHSSEELHQYLFELSQQYPDITRLYSIGESVEGRKLWVLEITEDPGKHTLLKPEFRYIANMHGNEIVGRELLLHLARLLVENYQAAKEEPSGDTKPSPAKFVKKLLRDTRIHLMPSMNPDGYSRSQVGCMYEKLSRRGRVNANNIDLNRNFPDNELGTSIDLGTQPEIINVMKWSKDVPFVLSANFHGGALVASYPFDSASSIDVKKELRLTPDDDIFKHLAGVYAKSHPLMMSDKICYDECTDYHKEIFPDGITNGAEWYAFNNGMQDWIYLNTNEFDITVEMGCNQYPPSDKLPEYWMYNKKAMISFIKEVHRGIKGTVRDSSTKVLIPNVIVHVLNRKHNVTSSSTGDYFRLLMPGFYEIIFDHPKYKPQKISVTISNGMAQIIHIKLDPIKPSMGTSINETPNPDSNINDQETQIHSNSTDSSEHSLLVATLVMSIVTVLILIFMAGAYVIQKKRLLRNRSMSMEMQPARSASTGISLPQSGSSTSHHLAA